MRSENSNHYLFSLLISYFSPVFDVFMKDVTIVCDGSSLGNGSGKSRAAAVAVLGYRGYWRAFGEFLGDATNQQAEIAAAWIGL